MKKLFGTMAVAAVLFAGYNAYEAQNSVNLNDVALANVEALASDSDAGSATYTCYNNFSGGLGFPRQCPSCIIMPLSTGTGVGTCIK